MKFYTYMWLRGDATPYYVGKGQGKRAIRKGCPEDPTRILIEPHESESDAFAAEIFLISYYGRKDIGTGILRNMTDGGDKPPVNHCGHCGPMPAVVRCKIGTSNTGKVRTPAMRARYSASRIGMKFAEDHRRHAAENGVLALHVRWHTNRGVVKAGCKHCEVSNVTT